MNTLTLYALCIVGLCVCAQSRDTRPDAADLGALRNIGTFRWGPMPDPATINEPVDSYGTTFLHAAAAFGNEVWINALLDAGADASVRDALGELPVHLAAQNGHYNAVALLDKETSSLPRNRYGWSPLHFACALGHEDAVRVLSERVFPPMATEVLVPTILAGDTPCEMSRSSGNARVWELISNYCPKSAPSASADSKMSSDGPQGEAKHAEPVVVLEDIEYGVQAAVWPDGLCFVVALTEGRWTQARAGTLSQMSVSALMNRLAETGVLDSPQTSYWEPHGRLRQLVVTVGQDRHKLQLGVAYDAFLEDEEYATPNFLRFCVAWKLALNAIHAAAEMLPAVHPSDLAHALNGRKIAGEPIRLYAE